MSQPFNTSLRRWAQTFIGRIFVYFCVLCFNFNYALAAIPSYSSQQTPTHIDGTSVSSMRVTNSDLGLVGPLSFGIQYGTLGQSSFNAQYIKKFNEYFSISALGEYGPDMYRYGGTLGFKMSDHDLFKISGEQFNQLLPFSFTTGNVNKRISQNAFGARFRHALGNTFIREINMGGYYAEALDKHLNAIEFTLDDLTAVNYRNIAGGVSRGADLSTVIDLTSSTEISAQLYYDDLYYSTKYIESAPHNAQGLGGGFGIKQLLGSQIALSAVANVRQIYNTYTGGISWLPRFLGGSELSFLAQRIISHNATPNSTIIGAQFGYQFGTGGNGAKYALSALSTTQDVGEWTGTPAVYMDQVLAISDETVVIESPGFSIKSMVESVDEPLMEISLSPASGPTEGETTVVITGENFSEVTGVKFGEAEAISFIINSPTEIVAVSPPGEAGQVDLILLQSSEKIDIKADLAFTYEAIDLDAVPTVTGIAPNAGVVAGGTSVVVTGTNFTGVTAVNFGTDPAASYTVDSTTQITAVSPQRSGSNKVNVTVTTGGGTSATSSANQFTYEGFPVITSMTPNFGLPAGGTSVTIAGSNYANTSSVTFGGVPAASFTVSGTSQITAVTPAGTAGTVDVIITTPVGTNTPSATSKYTYESAPVVTAISPNAGLPAGGTSVVITGSGFIGATIVSFAVTAAPSFTVDSATQITAISPAGASGTIAAVRVTTPLGLSPAVNADRFAYEDPPTVTNVGPNIESTAGGSVLITGTNFRNVSSVTFGGIAASFTVGNPTQITATSPPHSAGTVDVLVTTAVGTNSPTTASQYTYESAPAVTAISPNAGLPAGGTSVVITGTGFIGATGVSFGGANASFTVNNINQITAVSPVGTAGTSVDITVTTPLGTSTTSSADLFTYEDTPTITGLSPNAGTPLGGDSVVITGTNFTDAISVSFGAAFSPSYVVNSSTQITAVTPVNSAGTVNVRVTTPVGTSPVTGAAQFVYETVPTVTAVSPNAGVPVGGTSVIITGTNFTNATAVKFGATTASFTVNNATQITATSPVGTAGSTVDITVTTPVGTSVTSSSDQFTYEDVPTISSMSPSVGLPAGGTSVVITGTNFIDTSSVTFGGTAAMSFTVNSSTQITATSPAHSAGTVNVLITTPVGTNSLTAASQYTYESAPTVTGINPNAGLPAGGTSVVITGANFIGATNVHFGGVAAASFTVNSTTQITAVSPAGTTGTSVDITVTTPIGTSTTSSADLFTYEDVPTITGLSPNAGLPAGGDSVVITGTNFTDAISVSFGSNFAPSYVVNSSTQITAVTPANSAGTVNVRVTTPVGTSSVTAAAEFVYEDVPTVTGISPNAGVPAGGTSVTITGTNFTNATAVHFGGTTAASFTVDNATQITATSPVGTSGSTVNITVTTPVGTSATTSADEFIYEDAPTITSMSPSLGLPAGGTSVVITGTNFIDTTSVTFGGTAAASFTIDSSTQITATSPAHSVGVVDVLITTPVGTNSPSAASKFIYESVPTVTGVSPNAGVPGGGTSVVVTGTGFIGATHVSFGGATASFTVDTGTQITATSPAGTLGTTVDITVITPLGTSAVSSADQFTYEEIPTVTGLSPNAGLPAGGDSVVIAGMNFTGANSVKFGAVDASSFNVDSDTQITAVSPTGSGTVNVTVTTITGTSTVTGADEFTYEDAPTITSMSPNAGLPAGGTSVVITGTNFIDTTSVTFGGTVATNFTIDSATQITAISPANSAGTVDVLVTTPVGTNSPTSASQFTYETVPTITAISPNAGLPAGGNSVVITGTNFTDASSVDFGLTPATSYTVDSAIQITAVVPAGSLGTVNIRVTTPVGTSSDVAASEYVYENIPTVTGVAPVAGLPAGGASVMITGTGFTNATAVNFGSTPAASFTVDSAIHITATSPAGTEGESVHITVTTPVGTSATSANDTFDYEEVPTITGISPNAGVIAGGTTVVITGTNFIDEIAITFGPAFATSFTVDSSTQVTAIAPAGAAGTYYIRATTPVGTSSQTPASQYTYEDAPTVTGVSPTVGLPAGGTPVIISGTGFINATAVNFGGTPATSFTVNSTTQITATSPAGTDGTTVDITVTTPVGTSATSSADQFTYEDVPTITSLSPNAGLPDGGDSVVITGTNFIDASSVNFGSTPATSYTVDSAIQITAIAPAGSLGTVSVSVTTPVGTSASVSASQYVYENIPTVDHVSPVAGLPAGGTPVTIMGTGFTHATDVNFGSTPAASFTVNSATQITATSPPGTEGQRVNITVTTPVGTSAISANDTFDYEEVPTITGVSPNAGVIAGGTTVVITGTNFTDEIALTFGTVFATSFTVDSSTQVTAIAPAGAAGTYYIRATTPVGTSPQTPASQYTYEDAPTVTGVSPHAGPSAGGTPVTITGTGFINASAVNFGGTPATSFTVNSATQITATSPAGTDDTTVDITVTTPVGTSTVNPDDRFMYEGAPTITELSPNIGIPEGGTSVVITGTNFTNATSISFGSDVAPSFVVNSATQITAVSPAHSIGSVDVRVTTPVGTSPITSVDQYFYENIPTITALSPNVGLPDTGSPVVITGVNFSDATAVHFGTLSAASFTINSATQITAITPDGMGGNTVAITVTNPIGVSQPNSTSEFSYAELLDIVINPSGSSASSITVETGSTTQLVAIGMFTYGLTQNLTDVVIWSTSNPSVATVSSDGMLSANAPGTAIITGTDILTGITISTLPISGSVQVIVEELSSEVTIHEHALSAPRGMLTLARAARATRTRMEPIINQALRPGYSLKYCENTQAQCDESKPGNVFCRNPAL